MRRHGGYCLTLYVNGDNGHIGDGVNQPTQLASNTFLTYTAVCQMGLW